VKPIGTVKHHGWYNRLIRITGKGVKMKSVVIVINLAVSARFHVPKGLHGNSGSILRPRMANVNRRSRQNNRSLLFYNTDTGNSHAIALAGSNLPAGTVTQRQYAVAVNPNTMSEAHTGEYTGKTAGAVNVTTSSVKMSSTWTLPPYSITAIDYAVGGTPTA
jgi:hypothetical protein